VVDSRYKISGKIGLTATVVKRFAYTLLAEREARSASVICTWEP